MTDHGSRTGATRDVPPPRPVPPAVSAAPVEETGLGRAARAVADAVTGLVGGGPSGSGRLAAEPGRVVGGLREVVGAVATAVGSALGGGGRDDDSRAGTAPSDGASAAWTPGALLGDLLAAAAPRLPIRDGERLRRAYPGASDAEIAEALVARTALVTGGIGAATGGVTAAQWFAPASFLMLPLQLGAETVLVAGVEVVLIGELHELYGRPAPGDVRDRAAAYLADWSTGRPVDGVGGATLGALLGSAGVRALRRGLTRRVVRGIPAAAPFMIGAAIAGRGNRRATETLAGRVLTELRAPGPAGSPGS